jgi:transcriptional regulator with XRE-family HTH domain
MLINTLVLRGLSQRRVAAEAHIAESYLSEVINGRKQPSADVARAIDEALGCDGELAAHVHPLLSDEESDRFTAAVAEPTRVSQAAVNSLAAVLAAQRNADDLFGSAALLKPTLVQLEQVERLVRNCRGTIRSSLVSVASQWAQFSGWLLLSCGKPTEAEETFRTALQWATEVNDITMVATVLSYQAHSAWLRFQPAESLGLSEAALRDPAVHPTQRSYDAFQAARGHALFGDLARADELMGLGDELAAQADARMADAPPWEYYRGPWVWAVERGLVDRYAGRHDPARTQDAVRNLRAGLGLVPEDMRQADWYAEYETHLVFALLTAGERTEAAAVLADARRIVDATESARVGGTVRQLERRMATDVLLRR